MQSSRLKWSLLSLVCARIIAAAYQPLDVCGQAASNDGWLGGTTESLKSFDSSLQCARSQGIERPCTLPNEQCAGSSKGARSEGAEDITKHPKASTILTDTMPRPVTTMAPTASPGTSTASISRMADIADYRSYGPDNMLLPRLNHRYDFANFDSGARIVAYASHLRNVRAIQRVATEAYMIGNCNKPTWIVMAFPEKINLEHLALHFFELYSSSYSRIAVLGAQSFPTNQWKLLAMLKVDARERSNYFDLKPACANLRDTACWVSHLKLQVMSYKESSGRQTCTLSQLQVYGTTVLQGLETKMSSSKKEAKADGSSVSDGRSDNERKSCPVNNASKATLSPWYEDAPLPMSTIHRPAINLTLDESMQKWRGLYRYFSSTANSDPESTPLVDLWHYKPDKRPQFLNALAKTTFPLEQDHNVGSLNIRSDKLRPSEVLKSLARHIELNIGEFGDGLPVKGPAREEDEDNEGPQLIALVDRVNQLEKQVGLQGNMTLNRLKLLREAVVGSSALSELVENVSLASEHFALRLMDGETLLRRLATHDIAGAVAIEACRRNLRRLFGRKRPICIVAAYFTGAEKELDDQDLLSKIKGIDNFTFQHMVNLKKRHLESHYAAQQNLENAFEPFGTFDFQDDTAYQSARMYLSHLASENWLTKPLRGLKGPISLYLAVTAAETICCVCNFHLLWISLLLLTIIDLSSRLTKTTPPRTSTGKDNLGSVNSSGWTKSLSRDRAAESASYSDDDYNREMQYSSEEALIRSLPSRRGSIVSDPGVTTRLKTEIKDELDEFDFFFT